MAAITVRTRAPSGNDITPERLAAATRTDGEIPEDIFAVWLRQGLDRYTYFARGKWTGRIKIGASNNPWRRVAELIRSNNGEEAELLCTLRGQHLEASYHQRFADHLHGCEWFWPHPEIMTEIELLQGGQARALQHEIDHLDGILITDNIAARSAPR